MGQRVVVTGLGCVSPLGNSMEATWQNALRGYVGTAPITKFDASDQRCQIAAEVKGFDSSSVIKGNDAKKIPHFAQYALVATAEALQDASLEITEELADEVGVALGVGIGSMETLENAKEIQLRRGPRRISPFTVPKMITNMGPGFVSMHFNCRNYSAVHTSACASANHAIGDAARMIERGDAEVMISGGAEACITPLSIAGFAAMRALSTRNDSPGTASRPYDSERDGFVMGEGSAILVLESYELARARGARIYCEVVGYGASSDAHHVTMPSVEGPAKAMLRCLKDGGLRPEQIDYINAHGTSTPTGDLNELRAIRRAFGDRSAERVSISSTKAMSGHLLGAAGALEGVLTVKMMQAGHVLPTVNIDHLDPGCDLDVTPNQGKKRQIAYALSNSFGFGGTNASLVFGQVD